MDEEVEEVLESVEETEARLDHIRASILMTDLYKVIYDHGRSAATACGRIRLGPARP
jgi:hypothetical protein